MGGSPVTIVVMLWHVFLTLSNTLPFLETYFYADIIVPFFQFSSSYKTSYNTCYLVKTTIKLQNDIKEKIFHFLRLKNDSNSSFLIICWALIEQIDTIILKKHYNVPFIWDFTYLISIFTIVILYFFIRVMLWFWDSQRQ